MVVLEGRAVSYARGTPAGRTGPPLDRVFALVFSAIHIGSNMIHAQVSECTHHHVGVCDLQFKGGEAPKWGTWSCCVA